MIEERVSAVFSLLGGILLFGLVLFSAWLCTRWMGGRMIRQNADSRVKVLERISIGPDRGLMVVQVGEQVWLLGVTAHHINKIGELPPEQFQDESPSGGSEPPGFARVLQKTLEKWTLGKQASEEQMPGQKWDKRKQDG